MLLPYCRASSSAAAIKQSLLMLTHGEKEKSNVKMKRVIWEVMTDGEIKGDRRCAYLGKVQ